MTDKEKFKQWVRTEQDWPFKKKDISAGSFANYQSGLNRISDHLGNSIYAITTISELRRLVKLYSPQGVNADIGQSYNGAAIAGLKLWLNFQCAVLLNHFAAQPQISDYAQEEVSRYRLCQLFQLLHQKEFDWFCIRGKKSGPIRCGRKSIGNNTALAVLIRLETPTTSGIKVLISSAYHEDVSESARELTDELLVELNEADYVTSFLSRFPLKPDTLPKWPDEYVNRAWLLSWNPKHFSDGGDGSDSYQLELNPGDKHRWTSSSKQPQLGDRIFLIRLGIEPKGIIASGDISRTSFEDEDWRDSSKNRNYIEFEVEEHRPDLARGLLKQSELISLFPQQQWSPQSSGIEINPLIAEELEKLWVNNSNNFLIEEPVKMKLESLPVNKILYGPPGTGKTYNTINQALAIVEPASLQEGFSRTQLKAKFDEFVSSGQIVFTTFHQSFSYEDFVEGLRAESENGQLNYKIESGIFKQICERASEGVTETDDPFDQALTIFTDALASHDGLMTLKTITGKEFDVEYGGGNTLLVYPKSNKSLKNGYTASLALVRQLYRTGSKKGIYNPSYVDGVLRYLKSNCGLQDYQSQSINSPVKPFVLIIDEINRGNISNIFGELITLIEPSKRSGGAEALSVKLPYSKESFSVPSNLHIIGTMNTADKSLAQVDIALRRRFEFVELMPQHGLLSGIAFDGIDVAKILKTINQRIELLYDREHTIGHSFFLPLKDDPTIERLARIFELEILPLLEEYFFEDWERVGQVLGDHLKTDASLQFIEEKFTDSSVLQLMGNDWSQDGIRPYQRNDAALSNPDAYKGIYDAQQG
ncbi:McrB family protein [Shewanella frigidimarina]|uniref:McrB family protein n=1 Tax=Shewanella frigidimarina TaxID=56812 RepID=UPI003D7A9745